MESTAIVLFCVLFLVMKTATRDIIIEDEPIGVQANNIQDMDNEENGPKIGSSCHVEYQVVKRVVGHCLLKVA
ncbi:hypothetical protein Trydic_g9866 [Trypoxylus dichotomus]